MEISCTGSYILNGLADHNQVVRQCVEVILFENPAIKPDARPDLSPITLALKLDTLMGITKSSEVIPVLNGGFVADGQRYGLFGHDNRDDFVLNFYVPLLIESGFPMSEDTEAINRLSFKNEPLSSVERDYILENLRTPRSLKLCCRDTLRKAYKGRQIHNFVAKTDMPKAIKDYVLLKPLLKCVPENRILRYTTPLQRP